MTRQPGTPAASGRVMDLGEMLDVLRRRIRLIALVVALVTGAALLYSLTAAPFYTASVSLLIDARARTPVGAENAVPATSPDNALVESQVKVISSDIVLRRVVQSEDLADDPEFGAGKPGLRARLFALLGLGSGADARRQAEEAALARLARQVTVKRSERTYVIEVDVTAASADRAARLANAVARAYTQDLEAARNDNMRRDTDWLKGRLEDLHARVQDAERKVEKFKADHNLVNADGKPINERELMELSSQLVQAQARVTEAQAKYQQVQRVLESGRGETITDVMKSGVIERLRQQYAEIARQEANYRTTLGARHPAMQEVQQQLRDTRRLIDEEVRRMAQGLASDMQAARANAEALRRQLDAAKTAANANGQVMVELRELEREAEAGRVVYERFLRARENVNPDSYEAPLARIIAPATAPAGASGPKRTLIMVMAMASSLGLGCGLALAIESLPAFRRRPRAAELPSATVDPDILGVFGPFAAGAVSDSGTSWKRLLRLVRPGSAPSPVGQALAGGAQQATFDLVAEELESRAHVLAPRQIAVTALEEHPLQQFFISGLADALARRGMRVLCVAAGSADRAAFPAMQETGPSQPVQLDGASYIARRCGAFDIAWPAPQDVRAAMRMSREGKDAVSLDAHTSFDIILFDVPVAHALVSRPVLQRADQVVALVSQSEVSAAEIDAVFDGLGIEQDAFAGVVLLRSGESVPGPAQKKAA